jgi:hypothetical protein
MANILETTRLSERPFARLIVLKRTFSQTTEGTAPEGAGRALADITSKRESAGSMIISVNSKIRIPAELWRPENRAAALKRIEDIQWQAGPVVGFSVVAAEDLLPGEKSLTCPTCGWIHDPGFTQIIIQPERVIMLAGILTQIVDLVHREHEKGFRALSSKNEQLVGLCAGYRHPCKAFDDLKHRIDYKTLFDTRKRGFISLRGAIGINRNKSESRPE